MARHEGVKTARHKLIHFYEKKEWELFDLEKDSDEMKSVYGNPAYAKVQDELLRELERLKQKYKVPAHAYRPRRAKKKSP